MASITLTTTAEEDTAIQFVVAQFNANRQPPLEPLTARDFIEDIWRHNLDSWVTRYRQSGGETRRQLYEKATTTDRAAIDAILDKYR
jgi:hypothetical protein